MKIRTFVGTTENAVQTQIWTALIAMLLVKGLQIKSSFNWSLSNLVALLRQQLFVYRDLFTWLNNPFQPPPALEGIHDASSPWISPPDNNLDSTLTIICTNPTRRTFLSQ